MPDISKIAAACAARIFDRMEMCRGSAILKSDIEREVEMALRELHLPEGFTLVDTEHDERIGRDVIYIDDASDENMAKACEQAALRQIERLKAEYFGTVTLEETKYDERIGHPVTAKLVEPPAAGVLGEARKALEDYRASRPEDAPMTATEVRLDRSAATEAYSVQQARKDFDEAYERVKTDDRFVDPPLTVQGADGWVHVFEDPQAAIEFLSRRRRVVLLVTEDDIAEVEANPMEETQSYKEWLDKKAAQFLDPKHARLVLSAFLRKMHREYARSSYQGVPRV